MVDANKKEIVFFLKCFLSILVNIKKTILELN